MKESFTHFKEMQNLYFFFFHLVKDVPTLVMKLLKPVWQDSVIFNPVRYEIVYDLFLHGFMVSF